LIARQAIEPAPVRDARLLPLDALRGLIMPIMALDHASFFIAHRHGSEFWGGEITRYDDALAFLTRFVTHFCAPGFFFLMGCGMALFAASRRPLGWSHGRIARFFVSRGLLLVLVNQIVENPSWILGILTQVDPVAAPPAPGPGGQAFLLTGVLTALGLTLATGGLLLRLGSIAWLILGAAGLWVTNAFTPSPAQATVAFHPILRLLLIPGQTGILMVLYPLIPWFALAALGVAYGRWLRRGERAALHAASWIGALLVLAAIGMRAAGGFGNLRLPRDRSWIEFLNFVKYPPALVFSFFMVGGNLLVLGLFAAVRTRVGVLLDTLAVFGRAPLFFYLAHLWLFSILGAVFFRRAVGLQTMYLVWAAGLVPLWLLCRRYRAFKERKPAESIWRLF